jgi:hypothetical protein
MSDENEPTIQRLRRRYKLLNRSTLIKLAVEEKRDALAVDVFMLHYSRMESRVPFILVEPVH